MQEKRSEAPPPDLWSFAHTEAIEEQASNWIVPSTTSKSNIKKRLTVLAEYKKLPIPPNTWHLRLSRYTEYVVTAHTHEQQPFPIEADSDASHQTWAQPSG